MPLELDPTSPFESILIEMAELHRKKRADYAKDGDSLSNFFDTAFIMRGKGFPDFDALTSADYLLAVKEVRLASLRHNGRLDDTANESVRDTLIDMCNYQVLKLAIYDRKTRGEDPE